MAAAFKMLAAEPDTLLMSISRTPSREHHFNWIAKVMDKQWEVCTLVNSNTSLFFK
jgi:polar amino acid transport system substrate-binding protein